MKKLSAWFVFAAAIMVVSYFTYADAGCGSCGADAAAPAAVTEEAQKAEETVAEGTAKVEEVAAQGEAAVAEAVAEAPAAEAPAAE